MLVLSRKLHQRIFIGNDTVIEVTEIRDGQVKLGISCSSREIEISREELLEPDDERLKKLPRHN